MHASFLSIVLWHGGNSREQAQRTVFMELTAAKMCLKTRLQNKHTTMVSALKEKQIKQTKTHGLSLLQRLIRGPTMRIRS